MCYSRDMTLCRPLHEHFVVRTAGPVIAVAGPDAYIGRSRTALAAAVTNGSWGTCRSTRQPHTGHHSPAYKLGLVGCRTMLAVDALHNKLHQRDDTTSKRLSDAPVSGPEADSRTVDQRDITV